MSDEEFATQRYKRANTDEQMQWNKERIVDAIHDFDWTRSKADAFIARIYETLQKSRGWRLDKPETLRPFIERANLPMDRDLETSLRDAWSRSSFMRCEAFDRMVLDTASAEGFIDFHDSNFLLGVIQRLGQESNWTPNARGEAEIAQNNEAAKRQRLIAGITGAHNV